MSSVFILSVQLSKTSRPWILHSMNRIIVQVNFALMLTLIRLLLSVNSSGGLSTLKPASSSGQSHTSDPDFQAQSSLNTTAKHSARDTLRMIFAGCQFHLFACTNLTVNQLFIQWMLQQQSQLECPYLVHIPLFQLVISTCALLFLSSVTVQQNFAAGKNTQSYTLNITEKSTVLAAVSGLDSMQTHFHQ